MKLKHITLAIIPLFVINIFSELSAQTLSKFSPSDDMSYGLKKLSKKPKKIYIAAFNINFEVYKEAIDYKKGGAGFGGNVKGEATARGAIGLTGLDQAKIQEKTDQLYKEFIESLKAEEFEIVDPALAGATEIYKGWEKATGPYVIESPLPGLMVSVPSGYSFYDSGKEGPLANLNAAQKLSSELDDAAVATVNLYFMYSEDGDSWLPSNGAEVKMLTNYRLAGEYMVRAPKEKGLKGSESFDKISSMIKVVQGKMGAGAEIQYQGSLKEALEIEGIIKKEKMVVYSKQSSATTTSFTPVVIAGPSYAKDTKWVDVDPAKYAEGLYHAGHKFLTYHLTEYTSNY
ncbi:hypothetical protein U3A58_15930 [Algoriphagus sp. C2-6-M1]|uniref:hypothetical protein n=1 Tax=Algoriphagus persicinus TaxID=3108754 RepID=UPI002B3A66B5|nr:hypothetical protein [Algoriphagus sp. C2-6-M1]MEB2781884.1 hypothetical protein [Algoriphagus sp. C2-6-M1]